MLTQCNKKKDEAGAPVQVTRDMSWGCCPLEGLRRVYRRSCIRKVHDMSCVSLEAGGLASTAQPLQLNEGGRGQELTNVRNARAACSMLYGQRPWLRHSMGEMQVQHWIACVSGRIWTPHNLDQKIISKPINT